MQLTRWNPRRNRLALDNWVDRMFDDFFTPVTRHGEGLKAETWNPAVDIYREDDHYVIKAELPGVDKKDIDVSVDGRVLTLKGTRTTKEEVQKKDYYRCERFSGTFQRTFTLSEDVDPEKIKAEYKDGVLTLEIPTVEEHTPRQISVH